MKYLAMRQLPADFRTAVLIYAVLGLILWPIPVFNVLHVESAAVVAFVAFFTAGWLSLRAFERNESFVKVLRRQEGALAVPWAMLTVSVLWSPNCGYLQGLMFYGLFPVISVVLGVALAYLLTAPTIRYRRTFLVSIGIVTVLGGPTLDYLFHPQFYSYNHVFGGILGPIYDEELAIRPGLFVFRLLTLCWAALAVTLGMHLRRQLSVAYPLTLLLVIGAAYVFAPQLGFVTTESQIRQTLGSSHQLGPVRIYYDEDDLQEYQIRQIADELAFRYAWLSERLEMSSDAADESARPPEHVDVYLYPDPDTKAHLTGSRYISVAPIWLATPQMHLLSSRFASSGGHELAHVFSRQFAATRFNISPVAGLIEGVAVALEPPRGLPSPDEQVITDAKQRGYEPGQLADGMRQRLNPFGFWTGRGAVSYTMVGSFTNFLIREYGAERFREVYRTGRFSRIYGRSVGELARDWERSLLQLSVVDAATAAYVRPRFAAPSLFEQRCPHYVPRHVRDHRAAGKALARNDTTAAVAHWERAIERRPSYSAAVIGLARLERSRGNGAAMLELLSAVSKENPNRWLLKGDAHVLNGNQGEARAMYQEALARTPLHQREGRAVVSLRLLLLESREILQIWLREDDRARAAESVQAQAFDPIHRLLSGHLFLQEGDFERTLEVWSTSLGSRDITERIEDNAILRRQWNRWSAFAHYGAGNFREAHLRYEEAAAAFRRAGDLSAVREMQDMAEKMEFLSER